MQPDKNKEWGNGRWQSIHVTAAWVDTTDKFKTWCSWIKNQVKNLPCPDCVKHAEEYVKANPPESAEDAFIWSWRFHNTVNSRLGKPQMEYATAKQLYFDGAIKTCNSGCSAH